MGRVGFSVVVPTFNEAPGILATLRDLSVDINALRERYDVELTIVDDGSAGRYGRPRATFLGGASERTFPRRARAQRRPRRGDAYRRGARSLRNGRVPRRGSQLSPDDHRTARARTHGRRCCGLACVAVHGGRARRERAALAPDREPRSELVCSRAVRPGRLHTFTGMVRALRAGSISASFRNGARGRISTRGPSRCCSPRARNVEFEIPADLVWPTARSGAPGRISVGKLWERMWLVVTTASVLSLAMRLGARRAGLGPLVLSSQTNGPCPSDP